VKCNFQTLISFAGTKKDNDVHRKQRTMVKTLICFAGIQKDNDVRRKQRVSERTDLQGQPLRQRVRSERRLQTRKPEMRKQQVRRRGRKT
jgi:hypothetical protein